MSHDCDDPSHNHGPSGGHQHARPPPQQQQQQIIARPDPALQAAIDASYKPVSIQLGAPNNSTALCAPHGLETCKECKLDFAALNALAKTLIAHPDLAVPPPPNIVNPGRSMAITKAKDEGNALYKQSKYPQAIQMYTMAINLAAGRPPWEPAQLMRDELAILICNRSAAYAAAHDYGAALLDAELVTQYKRPWSKGHFRKAKALMGLGKLAEARDAVALGLQFEPSNSELSVFLGEIDKEIEKHAVRSASVPASDVTAVEV